jgi:hypothetical protein
MELIAKQDMLNGIKAGERFDAPDGILVALGLAVLAPESAEPAAPVAASRRQPARRRTSTDTHPQ